MSSSPPPPATADDGKRGSNAATRPFQKAGAAMGKMMHATKHMGNKVLQPRQNHNTAPPTTRRETATTAATTRSEPTTKGAVAPKAKKQRATAAQSSPTQRQSPTGDEDDDYVSEEQADVVAPLGAATSKRTTVKKDASGALTATATTRTRATVSYAKEDVDDAEDGAEEIRLWVQVHHLWCLSVAFVAVPTYQSYFAPADNAHDAAAPPRWLLAAWCWVAYLTGQLVSLKQAAATVQRWVRGRQSRFPTRIRPRRRSLRRSLKAQSLGIIPPVVVEPETEIQQQQEAAAAHKRRSVALANTNDNNPWHWVQRKTRHTVQGTKTLLGAGNKDKQPPKPSAPGGGGPQPKPTTTTTPGVAAAPTTTLRSEDDPYSSIPSVSCTNFDDQDERPSWLYRLDPLRHTKCFPNPLLMSQLMRNEQLKKQQVTVRNNKSIAVVEQPLPTSVSGRSNDDFDAVSSLTRDAPTTHAARQPIGNSDFAGAGTQSVDSFADEFEYTIHPLLRVRGMDIFLTDNNDTAGASSSECFDVAQHEWFQHNGLRDVPTFLVNAITQWGHLLVYFEMPAWVTNLTSSLVEKPDDADAVKAFKRFLSGSDDYRNQRFKMIPSVVDGPMAIKVMAPPKKERVIHGSVIPLSWYLHDAADNRKPVVVCALDCVSGRAIRSMANLVKKYLVHLTLDLAMVIGAPEDVIRKQRGKNNGHNSADEDDDEPQACLGLFRFEHINVETCPDFPVAEAASLEEEEQQDIEMARRLSGISVEELKAMQQAEKDEEAAAPKGKMMGQ